MPIADYYSALSLSPRDTAAALRASYRDFIRRLDHGICRWPRYRMEACREVLSVLSDPVSRRSYDEQCHHEPLCEPVGLTRPSVQSPLSLITDSPGVRPSAAALLDRLRRNFTQIGIPKDEHAESLTVEVPVSPEEVRQLRSVRIAFPVFEPCQACSGRGRIDLFPCRDCAGEGFIETAQSLWQPIDVRSIIERSLAPFGIENLYLRLLFVVR